jgi:flagellar motor component MotA
MSYGPFKHVSSQLVSYSIGIISSETIIGPMQVKLKEEHTHLVEWKSKEEKEIIMDQGVAKVSWESSYEDEEG